jgi:hypothetical protein
MKDELKERRNEDWREGKKDGRVKYRRNRTK